LLNVPLAPPRGRRFLRYPATSPDANLQSFGRFNKGKSNKIIAYELNMCESTVKVHVPNIMKKWKAKNRTEIAMIAQNCFGFDVERTQAA